MITTAPLCRSDQFDRITRRDPGPSAEVLLRSACVVEYTVKPHASDAPESGDVAESPDEVLLTVYVRRCLLNPTQVRIVEV